MKKALVGAILFLAIGFGGVMLLIYNDAPPAPDIVAINDTIMTAAQSGDQAAGAEMLSQQLINEYGDMERGVRDRDRRLLVFLGIYIGAAAAAGIWLLIYCERSVLGPFRKLQRFARDVAAGNLDIPLKMDRHGRFGAFTESFDLMREELKKARDSERAADRSKKELVASLSHDIKTPVASIKAAAELMLVSARDEQEKTRLERIGAKAEQIDALITDMFHATLEELQELTVAAAEVHSTTIPDLVRAADYKGSVSPFAIPECVIIADIVRLQQVLDNIIGNSYKYAGTGIELRAVIDGPFLVMSIEDRGGGVPEEDLPLISNKFYRGRNAGEKSGYGLGLYISKYLITNMSGELECVNRDDGFTVKILLRLAG